MFRKPSWPRALALAALLCASLAARADITIYTDRSAFLAAVNSVAVDTFDDLPYGPGGIPFERTVGPYSYLVESFHGPWVTGTFSDKYLINSVQNNPLFVDPTAGAPTALGGYFFGTDGNGTLVPDATVNLLAWDANGYVEYTLHGPTQATFVGFVSDLPLQLGVLNEADGQFGAVNDLTLAMASPAPEPASPAMLLAGMCLLGVLARRRR